MSRREWVRRHFKPLRLEPPPPPGWGREEPAHKQHRLARNRSTRALARVLRPLVDPAIIEVIKALPAEDWDRIRRGRPALYFSMVDPDSLGDVLFTKAIGPDGRTYEVQIGWAPMPDGNIRFSSPDLPATLAHEIGHVLAGHQCGLSGERSDLEEQRLQMEADHLAAEWGFGVRLITCLRDGMATLRWGLEQGQLDEEWTKDSLKFLEQRIRALKAALTTIEESHARP